MKLLVEKLEAVGVGQPAVEGGGGGAAGAAVLLADEGVGEVRRTGPEGPHGAAHQVAVLDGMS